MKQMSGMRRVLLCETYQHRGAGIAAMLEKAPGNLPLQVLKAGDKETALKLLQTVPIALAIIEVDREGGETLALLRALGGGFPYLPLFVFNGFMIPGIAEKAREYEQIRYCEDTKELDRFLQLVMGELAGKKKGMIEGVQLVNFLEWLQSEKLSGQVAVSSGSRKGVLDFQEGWLVSARNEADPDSGTVLAEMSTWERVSVEFQEGEFPEAAAASSRVPRKAFTSALRSAERSGRGKSLIETLRLPREDGTLAVRIGDLRQAIDSVREAVGDSLLRMDIFLTTDGRSLVGWNSHPMACSAFSAITRSIIQALSASRFPELGSYYLLDLAAGRILAVLVCGELQAGMLLAARQHLIGLLTHIVLPDMARALARSFALEHPA